MNSSAQKWHDISDARLYGSAAMHSMSLFHRGWIRYMTRLCKAVAVAAWPIYIAGAPFVLSRFFADKLAELISKQSFAVIEAVAWLLLLFAGGLVLGGINAISDELACETVLKFDGPGTRSSDYILHGLLAWASLAEHRHYTVEFDAMRTIFDPRWYVDPMDGVKAAAFRIGLFEDEQIRRHDERPSSRLGSPILNLLLTLSLVSMAFVPSIAYAVVVDIDSVSPICWIPVIAWVALVYTGGKLTMASLGLTLLRRGAEAPTVQERTA